MIAGIMGASTHSCATFFARRCQSVFRPDRVHRPVMLELPPMSESAFSERIVQNLIDTDFYKLTMMQAVLHN